MAHGPVLAHARRCGHNLVPTWCLQACYHFDRSALVASSELVEGLAANPEGTVGIILETWPPTGPYSNEYTTAGVRSSVSDIVPWAMWKDFATQNTVQLQCPKSSKKQPEWRRRALRPLLCSTTPRCGWRLRQLGEAMVKGVYVHKLEDLCPVSLRRRVAPRPHTTCRGRGSGSGPPSCTRAWAICE